MVDLAYGLNFRYQLLRGGGENMQTVIGIFQDRFDAESAIDELSEMGFNPKDVSVVVKEGATVTEEVGSKGGSVAEGAVSGAATGGVLGGLAGLLVGIGALAIPGVGAFLIGGPIAAALGLSGAAAATLSGATTGALAGGLVGGLIGLGLPEDVARVYEERVREGAVLLAVPTNTSDGESEVRRVFEDYNADQIRTIREIRS